MKSQTDFIIFNRNFDASGNTCLLYTSVNSQKKPVKNPDLWKRLLKAKGPHQVTFIWVKGHDGHAQNERCDQLATTAADGDGLIDDVILE